MDVTVVCYGALRDRIEGQRETSLTMASDADVSTVIAALGIEPGSVFQILVNEEQAARSRRLNEGDTVTLMPPFTGG